MRDVLDHEPTWAAVVAAAVETGVAAGEQAAAGSSCATWTRRPTSSPTALAPRGFVPGADDFSERVARIFR